MFVYKMFLYFIDSKYVLGYCAFKQILFISTFTEILPVFIWLTHALQRFLFHKMLWFHFFPQTDYGKWVMTAGVLMSKLSCAVRENLNLYRLQDGYSNRSLKNQVDSCLISGWFSGVTVYLEYYRSYLQLFSQTLYPN